MKKIQIFNKEELENMGLTWHTNADKSNYLSDNLVQITPKEANDFYEAANTLYDMYCECAQYILDNDLLDELQIPVSLQEVVKLSWQNDVHWHLYSRFDFAGGVNNIPIKLLEFNANTPTSLFETLIIQHELLKKNNINPDLQFNTGYEAICNNFKRLVTLDESVEEFDKLYDGWKILFTSVKDSEEELTTRLLMQIAIDAGFKCEFSYIENVQFSEEGVFLDDENYEFCFMLIPWESIAIEEDELAYLLTKMIKNQKAIILNPAYTLIFQSKGILKYLWQLFPNHPLLLKADTKMLEGIKCVKKPFFGREGANVTIFNEKGEIIAENDGEYENNAFIYQEFADTLEYEGQSYQAGVFFAYEACALGFRKGGKIINNYSSFAAHMIKD
ncbi:glutathionylspermidine synthase family protein [Campylobacter canadensis]|uniref:Glutathionylspermidine synthase family protein n=2 Tax=Campylobacter canadensis TaxID=449520 RepID=A0ABS7WQP1_9BACT|nr:glutathionylspermidine synthase family protein [Campylobacter canadensis]MBZ7994691.1 glutathionylspermidine synthase family protein [Campylobacter canadensis]MBZ7996187.1 glutathionylspermidine synthase family protein [Campylobacter canadensis]MBZ7998113.1 glutathionylspermidine synthase family protein [Campylobacter canadensis]MBZ7999997.1 glutathionylspermidine synthase family protein [Campylobacter canadensis]